MPQPTPPPAAEGAIFHALLDAGADPRVAYTAEKRLPTMISDAIAPQLRPFLLEMSRRFDEIDRRLDTMAAGDAERDRRLDEHDRKLDVLAAQMRLVLAGIGLLVTVLIAVFGFLFTQ